MMMFKISVLTLLLCVGGLDRVSGASFSKVYVQSSQEVVPAEYIQYGEPVVSKPSAQISAAPTGLMVPVASSHNEVSPCGPISPVAEIASPASNVITYKSNVPAVVRNNEEPTSYEYSYVVYDDGTGDHKAQQESSDGGVVRGQYSLLQPDGYIREVHYTADDIKGFNAIVKKFLPVNVEAKNQNEKDLLAVPCHEVMSDDNHAKTQEVASNDEREETNVSNSPNEIGENPSEALTKASVECSDEKEIVETHEAINEGDANSNYEIHYESAKMTNEPKEDPSYQNIIKCVQNAIANNQIPAPLTYIILKNPC